MNIAGIGLLLTFVSIATVVVVGVNTFFAMWLFLDKQRCIKPPLPVLISLCASHNVILQVTVFIFTVNELLDVHLSWSKLSLSIMYAGLSTMSPNVWQSIFYYAKIVSSPNALMSWVKGNVVAVVYGGLILDKLYVIYFVSTLDWTRTFYSVTMTTNITSTNLSSPANNSAGVPESIIRLSNFRSHILHFHLAYLGVFIVSMLWAWGSTLVYLCCHLRRMGGAREVLSSPALQRQVRVIVQGLAQTLLYVICTVVQVLSFFPNAMDLSLNANQHLVNGATAMFTMGTTVNLGISQQLFRSKAMKILSRLKIGKL